MRVAAGSVKKISNKYAAAEVRWVAQRGRPGLGALNVTGVIGGRYLYDFASGIHLAAPEAAIMLPYVGAIVTDTRRPD
jgi:hypothetical protein